MRSTCCRALLVLGLMVLTGCATGGNLPHRTGLLMEPGEAREMGYILNWSTDLNIPNRQLVGAKVLGDLVVTVEDGSNIVTAVSTRDGSIRWRQAIGDPSHQLHPPARHDDQILVNTNHRLYLLSAHDGHVQAVQNLARVVDMGPVVAGGLAIFGAVDGTVLAHDLAVGYTEWEYQLTSRIVTPPIVDDGEVFAGDSSGAYVLLDIYGDVVWRGRTFDAISATPAMDQAAVYVASEDRSLYALNRGNGQDRWPSPYRTTQPLVIGPVSFDLIVLQPLPGKGVVALDTVDGTVRWQSDDTALPITRQGDDVILATHRELLRVELASGDVLARGETLALSAVLEGPDGSLILVSPRGRLLRINPAR